MAHWLGRLLGETPPPAPVRGAAAWREGATTALLAAVMLAYANGDAWRCARRNATLSSGTCFDHLGMLGLAWLWATIERHALHELGLGRHGLGRSLLWGLTLGGLGAAIIHAGLVFPRLGRHPAAGSASAGISRGQLLGLIAGRFLIGSALFEEIIFRGLLHAKLVRLLGIGRALLAGSGIFAAWHLVITWHNLRRANLPVAWFTLLYPGALGALFAGGLLFGLLRHATGHLAGSILAHWLMVVGMVLAATRPHRLEGSSGQSTPASEAAGPMASDASDWPTPLDLAVG